MGGWWVPPQGGVCDGELGAEGGRTVDTAGTICLLRFCGDYYKIFQHVRIAEKCIYSKDSNKRIFTLPRKIPWNLMYLIQTPIAK